MGLFFPDTLLEVEFRAPNDERILDYLYSLKNFHLLESGVSKDVSTKIESINSSLRSLELILRKLNLPIEKSQSIGDMISGKKAKKEKVPKQIEATIEAYLKIEKQIEIDLLSISELTYLAKEREQLHKVVREAHELIMFAIDFSKLETLKYVKWALMEVDLQDAQSFEAEIKTLGLCAIRNTMPEQKAFAYLVFSDSTKSLDKASRYVKNIKEISGMGGIPKEILRSAQIRLEEVLKKTKKFTLEKANLAKKHSPNLYAFREHFVLSKRREELLFSFPKEDSQVIIKGYVPKKDYVKAQKRLKDLFLESASVSSRDPEDPPTFLNSPGPLKNFEGFVMLYGLPKSYQINPVPFFIISFLLFFGLMFPDLGDASIIFTLAFVVAIRAPKGGIKEMASAVCLMALSGMAFALMFGELFAFDIKHLVSEYLPFVPNLKNAFEDPVGFLVLVLAIGLVHVIIGYILGMVNHAIEKSREKKYFDMLFSEQLGYLFLISAIISVAASSMLKFPLHIATPVGLVAAGVATIIKAQGVIGLVEVTKIVSNFFSYARILAYNMAHVGVGKAFLSIAGLAFGMGNIFGWIGAALVVVLSHAISIGIAGLGSLVHDLRLHFVEFFPKFYMGEGKVYKPLIEERAWSVIND